MLEHGKIKKWHSIFFKYSETNNNCLDKYFRPKYIRRILYEWIIGIFSVSQLIVIR